MSAWTDTYEQIVETIDKAKTDSLFYRGHYRANWTLLPGLARATSAEEIEDNLYFDFVIRAGELLPRHNDSWSNFFAMQHHGIPTRLLDWTETFGVALYFALKGGKGNAAIWILDPFALNEASINLPNILNPNELPGTYDEYYISKTKPLHGRVIAISPLRHDPRVFSQRAGFTLHDDLKTPLEKAFPSAVTKIVIPAAARREAATYLKLAGISEFSLFPDLDGLAREITEAYF